METIEKLMQYIDGSPSPYHAVAQAAELLTDAGYTALQETEGWNLEPGKGYFVT